MPTQILHNFFHQNFVNSSKSYYNISTHGRMDNYKTEIYFQKKKKGNFQTKLMQQPALSPDTFFSFKLCNKSSYPADESTRKKYFASQKSSIFPNEYRYPVFRSYVQLPDPVDAFFPIANFDARRRRLTCPFRCAP